VARVTVLLIDDERAIREATRELLRPMLVDVIVAATIAEAVELARQSSAPIDLILSDWRLRDRKMAWTRYARYARCAASRPGRADHRGYLADLLTLAHENGLIILHKPLQPRELVRLVERLAR